MPFLLANSQSLESAKTEHERIIEIIQGDNNNDFIDLFNKDNFTIAFPYHTRSNNSGLRKLFNQIKTQDKILMNIVFYIIKFLMKKEHLQLKPIFLKPVLNQHLHLNLIHILLIMILEPKQQKANYS